MTWITTKQQSILYLCRPELVIGVTLVSSIYSLPTFIYVEFCGNYWQVTLILCIIPAVINQDAPGITSTSQCCACVACRIHVFVYNIAQPANIEKTYSAHLHWWKSIRRLKVFYVRIYIFRTYFFLLKYHYSVFLRVQSTTGQYWFS